MKEWRENGVILDKTKKCFMLNSKGQNTLTGETFDWRLVYLSRSQQEEQKETQQTEGEKRRVKQRWKEKKSEGVRSKEGRQGELEPRGRREHQDQGCSAEGLGPCRL